MKEKYYDALLNIKTIGEQKGFLKSVHYHRYEPTPYSALETLCAHYHIKSSDQVVDFGCGKGRLNFYIHHVSGAAVKGIEMNEEFYQEAMKNKSSFEKKHRIQDEKIQFYCCLAEEYQIDTQDNRFYFFNPFTIQIFIKVVNNILDSAESNPRDTELILYYPSQDYIYYLENSTSFELKMEIPLPGLYEQNQNERFLIYGLR
ncbi:methyltransferase [Neobacillus sp. D3-1R]|uniref:methyltransferase n=1 Tax=Neobacillus sp. D3-1R TaxID=3445778 RepID=UPI003FA0E68E